MCIRCANVSQFFSDPTGKTHMVVSQRGEGRRESGFVNFNDKNLWNALHRGWRTHEFPIPEEHRK